jgi:BR serine/threonine kinase
MAGAKVIGNYTVLTSLGSGTSAKVKLAQDMETGKKVAIKILKRAALESKPTIYAKLQREIALMSLFEHSHVLRLYEVFESPRHLHIVLEYAEKGELFDLLVAQKRLSEEDGMEIFRQIIYALEYLHLHGVCHRDLKPENILLDSHNGVKIGDFGFARWMRNGLARTACGSPHYTAPEVIRAQPYSGKLSDIWSAGVILFTILAGRHPFEDPSVRNLLIKIKKGEFDMPQFDDDIQDLIYKILVVEPEKRITIEGIKQHPAFLKGLPAGYVLPTPLPLPSLRGGIEVSSIQPKMLQVLRQIGYQSDEELANELASDGPAMAKVFHFMLTRVFDRDFLPWSELTAQPSASEIDPGEPEDLLPLSVFESCYSLAKKADWSIGDVMQVAYEQEQTIEHLRMSSVGLMFTLQCIMNDLGYEWFHPDDITLVLRTRNGEDVTCLAEATEDDSYALHIRMTSGAEASFKSLVSNIRHVLVPDCLIQDEEMMAGPNEEIDPDQLG